MVHQELAYEYALNVIEWISNVLKPDINLTGHQKLLIRGIIQIQLEDNYKIRKLKLNEL